MPKCLSGKLFLFITGIFHVASPSNKKKITDLFFTFWCVLLIFKKHSQPDEFLSYSMSEFWPQPKISPTKRGEYTRKSRSWKARENENWLLII